MKLSYLLFCGLLFGYFSCAQVTSLNLKKHQFGQLPTKIVWFQVAGLNEEHLALLKFSYPSSVTKTAFEDFLCVGKAWEYDLFKIRPKVNASFLSQVTGKKNIKNTCDDYDQKPIWSYMLDSGYKVGVFEGQDTGKENSFLKAKSCQKQDFLKDIIIWKMQTQKKTNEKFFHISEKNNFQANNVYYDRSCRTGQCYSSLVRNVESVYSSFSKNNANYLFMVRNFSFQKAILQKDIAEAKDQLDQINQTLRYFQNLAAKDKNMLVILSSASARGVNFPRAGKGWEKFEKSTKFNIDTQTKLLSPVMAMGARAENFCGIYEQSEILSRIFSDAKQQGLEFTIINPFK